MIYPWQKTQWQQLLQTQQMGKLPHALLFLGLKGTGKLHFAECFVRSQLCQEFTNEKLKCECHSCRLVLGKAHPNILWIEPEKEGSAIKVDQVRDITEFANQTSLQGEYRFIIINPANNMNVNAANALLKTLEEPSSGSIMILISEQASHLPATILSRCQHIHFPQPRTDLALTWLREKLSPNDNNLELALSLTHGSPLTALQFIKNEILESRSKLLEILYQLTLKQSDPLKSWQIVKDLESIQILDFILSWIIDLLRLHMNVDINEIINKDCISQLTDLRQKTTPKNIIEFMNYLQQLRGQVQIGMNLNKQLMVESMLIRWMESASCF